MSRIVLRKGLRANAVSERGIKDPRYSSYVSDGSSKNGFDSSIVNTCRALGRVEV
jgi:hypothetical protein